MAFAVQTNPFAKHRPAPILDMEAWVHAEKTRILLDDDEKNTLLSDHWELRPAKVGHLLFNAASENDFLRRAARADLYDLIESLADTAACERFHQRVMS